MYFIKNSEATVRDYIRYIGCSYQAAVYCLKYMLPICAKSNKWNTQGIRYVLHKK